MTYKICQATTKKGQPCQNGAMEYTRYCGPHQNYNPDKEPPQQCQALTLKHKQCQQLAQPNSKYCTTHNDPRNKFYKTNNIPNQLNIELSTQNLKTEPVNTIHEKNHQKAK